MIDFSEKRRNLLVSKKFQFKYIGLILSFVFLAALMTGYTIYFTTWVMLGKRLAAVYPQKYLIDIVTKVNLALLLRLLFLCPLVILVGLILSNRIAGPIYRIKKFLGRVSDGDYDIVLSLRKNDELKDLEESVNNLVNKLSLDDKKRKRRIDILEREILEMEEVVKKLKNVDLIDRVVELKKSVDIVKNT